MAHRSVGVTSVLRRYRHVSAIVLGVCLPAIAHAQSTQTTWIGSSNVTGGAWTNGFSWSTSSGPSDVAVFTNNGAVTTLSISDDTVLPLNTILFDASAPAYTIHIFNGAADPTLTLTGSGIVNNSPNPQTFSIDDSTSGIHFTNSSTAGNAIINNVAGTLTFDNSSSAGSATITNSNTLVFVASSSAGSATIENASGGTMTFSNTSSAGTATITNNNSLLFQGSSTAGDATIINNQSLAFNGDSTTGNATIITNAGANTRFLSLGAPEDGTGKAARLITNAGGVVDFSGSNGFRDDGLIRAGSVEGAGSYYLGSNTLIVGSNNLSTMLDGAISNCGPTGSNCFNEGGHLGKVEKTGTGTLTLNGVNTYDGGTTVTGGMLIIGDSSHPGASIVGDVAVNALGTLRGHGTIGGSVTNGGIVNPGASIGILTVGGNYTQSSAGNLTIEITPNVAAGPGVGYSKVQVGGAASLAGSLTIANDPGTYVVGSRYTILTAAHAVSGTFTTQTYTSGFALYIRPNVTYDANDVYLTLDPAPGGGELAPGGGPAPLFNDGQQAADMLTAIVNAVGAMNDAVLDDMCDSRRGLAAGPGRGCETRPLANGGHAELWMRAFGGFGGLTGGASRTSFSNAFAGTLAGYGIGMGNVTVGAGVGYLSSMLDFSDGSDATQQAGLGFLYGRYQDGPLWLGAMAAYGGGHVNGKRVLPGTGLVAAGGRGADFASVTLRGAYALRMGAYTLQPRADLAWTHVGQDGFGETGAALLDLRYGASSVDTTQSHLAVRLLRETSVGGWTVAPWIELGARTLFSGLRRVVNVTDGNVGAEVSGVSPAPLAGTAGVGVDVAVSPALRGFIRYQGLFSANQVETALSLGARYEF